MAQLKEYEYIHIPYDLIPQSFRNTYNLDSIVHDGFIYAEIHSGMYGLPPAGILAHEDLVEFMAPYGYHPVTFTPGLWVHDTNGITFTLVVDDFGVKYTNNESLLYLINTLQKKYTITINREGNLYVGVTLDWKWNHSVKCSMPKYVPNLMKCLNHMPTLKPQYSPYLAPYITYGKLLKILNQKIILPYYQHKE